jgi:hypothetical protein
MMSPRLSVRAWRRWPAVVMEMASPRVSDWVAFEVCADLALAASGCCGVRRMTAPSGVSQVQSCSRYLTTAEKDSMRSSADTRDSGRD